MCLGRLNCSHTAALAMASANYEKSENYTNVDLYRRWICLRVQYNSTGCALSTARCRSYLELYQRCDMDGHRTFYGCHQRMSTEHAATLHSNI